MTNLSDRLKAVRSKLGIKQSQLAQLMGAGEATIKAMEQGRTKTIKARYAINIEEKLKISRAWLESGEGDMFKTDYDTLLSSIAKIDSALSGNSVTLPYYEDIRDTNYIANISMPISIINNPSKELLAVKINDDSMEGTIRRGDMIFINMDDTELVSGKIYKVQLNDELMIKRIYKSAKANQFLLKSDNPIYPELTVNISNFTVFGRVVATMNMKLL